MIARMDQLTVVGRKGIARELLQSLQSLGVMQIDPLEPAEGIDLVRFELDDLERSEADRWNAAVGRSESLLKTLGAVDGPAAPRSDVPTDLDGIDSYLAEVSERVDALVAER
jgi:vacuolar-type H+-ATPase subunit I/STV1